MVDATSKLSPGQALRQKQAEYRKDSAFRHLAASFLRDEVSGADVQRLHAVITNSAGDVDTLKPVGLEIALKHLVALNERLLEEQRLR